MDCRRIENIISPYLDGELSPPELEAVRLHLSVCANCNLEYEALRRIATACHDLGREGYRAPLGFADAVMDKIRAEQAVQPLHDLSRQQGQKWKRAAVGVAAAAMLALGALSLNPSAILRIADNFPGINQPVDQFPTPDSPVNIDPVTPEGTDNPASNGGNRTNPVVAVDPGANRSGGVFLNKQRYVVTTLLRVEVADTASALDQAFRLSADAQGQSLNLGQQVGEKGAYTAVRITVSGAQAADLIARLSSLGTVSGKEIDKNDITTKYADTLSQYQALITQRAASQDKELRGSLDQRIADLAADLQDWEQQAEQETIVLWLE